MRVQVSAPTSISLDRERVGRRSHSNYIVQTTDDQVVLRNGENSLCVVNAKQFCKGYMDVRHEVELPQYVTFSRNSSGKYGVAWGNRQKQVYIVNFHTGEVITRAFPSSEEIVDAFVDSNGKQLAVVTANGKLYGWSQCNWDYSEDLGEWSCCEWRFVEVTLLDTASVGACCCGRFVSSAVMGNCFIYLRARHYSTEAVVVEKWIFDVDANWSPFSSSSRTIKDSTSKSEEELKLFITENWNFAIVATSSGLYHIQVDPDLQNSSIMGLPVDQKILDGAWISQNAAFAMLLANGQISIASVSCTGRFELLGITTSSTMSKRLSLSALLGKAVSVARQLVWVEHEKQVIVDFETSCATFKLDLIDEEASSTTGKHSHKSDGLFLTDAFTLYNRRVTSRLHVKGTDFGDYIREMLDGKPSPTSCELIDAAKISLSRSQTVFEDLYFMLLCTLHQQLASESISTSNSRDPIDCIGKSLKLMEVLVSFTISMEAGILRQISSRIISTLPGCTTKPDRKIFYGKEIIAISQRLRALLNGVNENEDWWVYSRDATAFLRVYYSATRTLLHEISTSTKLKPGEATQIYSLCQRIIQHEDATIVLESVKSSERIIDRLTGLLTSYTYICCFLRVNGVMIDLEHYCALATTNISPRQEMLCCFLKPWIRIIDDIRPGISEKRMIQAVRFATESNTLHLLLNFSITNNSRIAHSCVQALCNAAEICTRTNDIETPVEAFQVDNLHWQACELYIGEAMSILHRIGPCREFKYSAREAEYSTSTISQAVHDGFDYYLRTLSAELWNTQEDSRVASSPSSQWEYSQYDERLRSRVIRLISRIIWHLEVINKDCINLVQRAFALDMFDSQLGPISKEPFKLESLQECITNVRGIVNSEATEVRLLRSPQPEGARPGLCVRTQKIARSLVLIAWALWLREKAAICSRNTQIGKLREDCHEMEVLGAQVATYALSLDALGTMSGDNERLLSIQLTLLEDASRVSPRQTAEVIAWGFPARKILTRYLKRYRRLRLAVQRSCVDMSLEENELQYQQLQNRIRQKFYQFHEGLLNKELNHDDTRDIDLLVACCCYPEFLHIMSVLTKCPREVVAVTRSTPPPKIKTFVQEIPENVDNNIDMGRTTRADHDIVAASNSDEQLEVGVTTIADSELVAAVNGGHLVERPKYKTTRVDPVMIANSDEQIEVSETLILDSELVTAVNADKLVEPPKSETTRAGPDLIPVSHGDEQMEIGVSTIPDYELVAVVTGEQLVEPPKSESVLSRDEVMALLQEQTRHLEEKIHAVTVAVQPKPSCAHEGDQKLKAENILPLPDRKEHASAHEIMSKTVDAHKETSMNLTDFQRMARISLQVRDMGRHRYSSTDKKANPLSRPVQGHDSVRNVLKLFRLRQENGGHTRNSDPGDLVTDNENGTPNIEAKAKVTSDVRGPAAALSRCVKPKRSDTNKKSSRYLHGIPLKEPVFPLKLEYGVENASLKLLGRNHHQRNPSVKKKQFVHHERRRLHKVNTPKTRHKVSSDEPTEVILLKTVHAQTNDSIETATKGMTELMNEIGPEKESPVAQEREGDKPTSVAVNTINLRKGVGVQCQVDNGLANARNKRGQTTLSIADKYPIWVDLDSANNDGAKHFKERKKFLQVARFGGPDTTDLITNNDTNEDTVVITSSPSVASTQEGNLEDGSDENQADSPKREFQEDQSTEQKEKELKERYRASYRDNYPIRERLGKISDDVGGITSLIDLRDNMQRMTQRLQVLETCANSIDEEFKVSQKRLTQIGDVDGIPFQSQVLEDIDQVLETTKEASSESDQNPRGVLSKKASRDLGAAKYDLSISNDNLSSPADENLLKM